MPLNTPQLRSEIKAILTDELAKKNDSDTSEQSVEKIATRLSDVIETFIYTADLNLVATVTTTGAGTFPVVFTTKLII